MLWFSPIEFWTGRECHRYFSANIGRAFLFPGDELRTLPPVWSLEIFIVPKTLIYLYLKAQSFGVICKANMVNQFQAFCFQFMLWDATLVRFPVGRIFYQYI